MKSCGYGRSVMQQAQAVRTNLCDSVQTRKKKYPYYIFQETQMVCDETEDGKHLCLLSGTAMGTGRLNLLIKSFISE